MEKPGVKLIPGLQFYMLNPAKCAGESAHNCTVWGQRSKAISRQWREACSSWDLL